MQSGRKLRAVFRSVLRTPRIDGVEESLDEIALGVVPVSTRLTLRVDVGGMTALMARSPDLIAAYNALLPVGL
jgi:hypothetical protein